MSGIFLFLTQIPKPTGTQKIRIEPKPNFRDARPNGSQTNIYDTRMEQIQTQIGK